MAHSRETRVPFLDHELVEFCLALPPLFKHKDGITKRVMREVIKDVVPDKVSSRKDKQGYSSPVPIWIRNQIGDFFREALSKAAELHFADRNTVLKKFDCYREGNGSFDPFWWQLVAVDRWRTIFKISL